MCEEVLKMYMKLVTIFFFSFSLFVLKLVNIV